MPRRDRERGERGGRERRGPAAATPPPVGVAQQATPPPVQQAPGELPQPAKQGVPITPPLAPPKPNWKQDLGQDQPEQESAAPVAPVEAPQPEASAQPPAATPAPEATEISPVSDLPESSPASDVPEPPENKE